MVNLLRVGPFDPHSQLNEADKKSEKWESLGNMLIFVVSSEKDKLRPFRVVFKSMTKVCLGLTSLLFFRVFSFLSFSSSSVFGSFSPFFFVLCSFYLDSFLFSFVVSFVLFSFLSSHLFAPGNIDANHQRDQGSTQGHLLAMALARHTDKLRHSSGHRGRSHHGAAAVPL
jgi:hypothetical protein